MDRRWWSPWRLGVLAVLAVSCLLAAVPFAVVRSMRVRADALDAEVAARREAYEGYEGDTRHGGDRDCDTSEELALRYPDPLRIASDDDLIRAVDDALRCRRTWNGPATVFGHLLVFRYLVAPGGSDADACVLRAARALQLADRLASSRNTRPELFDPALARLLRCADGARADTRAQAVAQILPLVEDPVPAWYATEAAALMTASAYASVLREHASTRDLVEVGRRWLAAPGSPRPELGLISGYDTRGRDALALASASRGASEADLPRLAIRGAVIVSLSRGPIAAALPAVLEARARVRAAIIALDPARVSQPGLGSPWTGTPMRVRRDASGLSMEYDGPGPRPVVLRATDLAASDRVEEPW